MFKLVVLCAFLAAAAAEPGVALTTVPATYSAAAVAPLTTSYVNPISGVYQPAVTYSTPYGLPHFIKKRAVPVTYSSYVAPTYVSSAPLAATYTAPYVSSAPYVSAGPVYTTAAHLIKKRAAVLPTTYVAPTTYATAPYVSTYSAAPVYTTPYVSAAPVYTPHFIKKRSVPVAVSSYVAPTSYSSQTRVDYTAPVVHSYAAASPVAYTAPVTHFV